MEILRNKSQIYQSLSLIFEIDANIFDEEKIIFEPINDSFLFVLCDKVKNKKLEQTYVHNLTNLIFQMNDFVVLLGNLVKVFLSSKQYEAIFYIINKTFVAHIGNVYYKSTTPLLFNERNFDRFVEVVKNCEIPNQIVVPFLIDIYKCEQNVAYYVWKRPALEFLQYFWNNNEEWFLNFINQNPHFRYKTLGAILEFNTSKGVEYLINDYIQNADKNLEENLSLIKHFKREVLHYIDCEMLKSKPEKQRKFLEILLSMEGDNEVFTRIQDFFNNTKNTELKNFISSKIFTNEKFNIKSEKQFLNAARNSITEVNERIYNIPFEKLHIKFLSGNELNFVGYMFLIKLFKEEKNLENLLRLKSLENIFETQGLEEFAQKLFDYSKNLEDVLQTKWAWRFVCLFANNSLKNAVFDFLEKLYTENRKKEAKYLENCLIACKLMQKEDVFDLSIPQDMTHEEIEKQKEKLFNDFIAGKFYSFATFERLFLNNPIYNKFAQSLIFGEYRFGRLLNAFHIIGTNKSFLIGESVFSEDDDKNFELKIGIIHPLDCDFKFEKIFGFFKNPIFNQFKKTNFNVNDYGPSTICLSRFTGIVSDSAPFLAKMLENKFQKNKNEEETEFSSLVHIFEPANMLCEVEFEKTITSKTSHTTMSGVYFYKLSETLKAKNKYLTQKSNAIPLNMVPYRYFGYIASIILSASKL